MSEEQNEKIKCLIIGSGPSGCTAAIYTDRAELQPVIDHRFTDGVKMKSISWTLRNKSKQINLLINNFL
jgi:thioredoxin reductase